MTAKQLNPTQIKIVKAKAAGLKQREIGKLVYPNANPNSQSVSVSRELKKANVQEELVKAFKRHGITIDSAIKPIAEGLKADKVSIVGNGEQAMAEVTPDHSIRLKASGMALNLMGLSKQQGDVSITFIDASQRQRADYDL